jgi:hypothetical protein
MRHRPGALAWPWLAAAPVKAPESLAESQMRQLDNQESLKLILNRDQFETDSFGCRLG